MPLRARTSGLRGLKQSVSVRLAHPLRLRQVLKLLQHLCEHPSKLAAADTLVAAHAELQDWKSFSQTRTLWLPAPQADLGTRMIDCSWLPGTAWLPSVCASATPSGTANKSATNNSMVLIMEKSPETAARHSSASASQGVSAEPNHQAASDQVATKKYQHGW